MIRKYSTTPGEPLTEEQKEEIKEAQRRPITFDEDCPELSPAMMKMLRAAVKQRNIESLRNTPGPVDPPTDRTMDLAGEPDVSAVDSISGILRGKVSEDIDRHALRDERIAHYATDD